MYISSRSAKDCAATEKELNALGPGKCVALPADMQKLEEVDRLVKELSAKEKAIGDEDAALAQRLRALRPAA